MATKPDLRLKVGAYTEKQADLTPLYKDIDTITGNINKDPPKIALTLDSTTTKNNITVELNKIIDNLKVNPVTLDFKVGATNTSGIGKGAGNGVSEKLKSQIKGFSDGTMGVGFERIQAQFKSLGSNAVQVIPVFNDVKKAYDELKAKMQSVGSSIKDGDISGLGEKDQEEIKKLIKDYDALIAKFNQYKTAQTSINKTDTGFAKQRNELETLILSMENYLKINDRIKTDSDKYAIYQNRLKEVQTVLNEGMEAGKFDDTAIKTATANYRNFQNVVKAAGLEGQTFFTRLRNQMSKLGVYFSGAGIFLAGIRAIKQMTKNVIELDTAMTELKKVTEETDKTYSKFLDDAELRAKKLGATLTDVVTATADFARLGYNLVDAEELANAAIIYKNVGDGIKDVSDASESIISTMKAFKIEAADAMTVVDRFNKVGRICLAA